MKADLNRLCENALFGDPFPHLVIDEFLDEESANTLASLCKEKASSDEVIRHTNNITDNRIECRENLDSEEVFIELEEVLRSDRCVAAVSSLLGIQEKLQGDTDLFGSGVHCLPPGELLGMHLDFKHHPRTGLCRRLNTILYLNRGYKREHGGLLELAIREKPQERKSIEPLFNRLVVFPTNDYTLHGIPRRIPVDAPNRYSIAYYHYSETRPDSDIDSKREYESTWYLPEGLAKGALVRVMRLRTRLIGKVVEK